LFVPEKIENLNGMLGERDVERKEFVDLARRKETRNLHYLLRIYEAISEQKLDHFKITMVHRVRHWVPLVLD
jgi:hypothetical protein